MDGCWNSKWPWTRLLPLAGLALVPAAGLHAEELTSSAAAFTVPAPAARRAAVIDFKALAQNASKCVVQWREELVRELVATQLPLIGGHVAAPPKTTKSSPPPKGPPAGGNGNVPPPPPPGDNGNPTNNGGTPPTGLGDPPPANTPEPTSVLTALLGAGVTSLTAWRYRPRQA